MARISKESPAELKARAKKIYTGLNKLYPKAHCELDFKNPLQLLVATILAAQCTDKRVNMVTPALFKKYKKAEDFASAKKSELEELIKSTGFYKNKTTSIIGMARKVCDDFGGKIPNNLEDLVSLPGVGRKTANVILGNAFDIPGITFAVFLPTPGRETKSSKLLGTFPPKSSQTFLAIPIMLVVLFL